MFRRRPFRRPRLRQRRPQPRPPLPRRAHRALTRANRLMESGQHAEAADIFERLSQGTERRGALVRAADLALQASRAHFAADDVEAALEWARQTLRLFVRSGRVGRVSRLLSKMAAALRERGYDSQANQLERDVEQALKEMGLSLDEAREQAPQATEKRGSLPSQCHGCGAALLPDEVEWHDAHTAECPYCGTVVKAH